MESAEPFGNTYPLNSELSIVFRYLLFEQQGPSLYIMSLTKTSVFKRRKDLSKVSIRDLKTDKICNAFPSVERDNCHPNPCHHGGVCDIDGEDFTCSCSSGWTGLTCEG